LRGHVVGGALKFHAVYISGEKRGEASHPYNLKLCFNHHGLIVHAK
jgi:hypothetical protein